jgi:hypothetical protein
VEVVEADILGVSCGYAQGLDDQPGAGGGARATCSSCCPSVYFLKRFSKAVRASMGRAELGVEAPKPESLDGHPREEMDRVVWATSAAHAITGALL